MKHYGTISPQDGAYFIMMTNKLCKFNYLNAYSVFTLKSYQVRIVLVDGLDGMVIIGQQSSKSTFDANNGTMKKNPSGMYFGMKRPNIFK